LNLVKSNAKANTFLSLMIKQYVLCNCCVMCSSSLLNAFYIWKILQSIKLVCKHVHINKWQMGSEFVVKFWFHKNQCRKTPLIFHTTCYFAQFGHLKLFWEIHLWLQPINWGTQSQKHSWQHGLEILFPIFESKIIQPLPKHSQNHIFEWKIKQNKINSQAKMVETLFRFLNQSFCNHYLTKHSIERIK
jgi:hypothetical protein